MKDRYQTSFVVDKKLWIKFKSKTLKEGVSIKDKLHSLMTDYVNNNLGYYVLNQEDKWVKIEQKKQ